MSKNEKIPFGAVCAEAIVLGGAKRAAEIADQYGRRDLAEKIRWGEFAPPSGKFNAARAQARVAALKLLAA